MARKWSNLNLPGALHYVTGNFQVWQESFKGQALWSSWMIWQKINYIHANPVKAGLVKTARDHYWSSFRSFYSIGESPLAVDHEWWWPDDGKKLSEAIETWVVQLSQKEMKRRGQAPFLTVRLQELRLSGTRPKITSNS